MPGLTILHGCWTLQLNGGESNTLIDAEDVLRVGLFSWYMLPNHKTEYVRRHRRLGKGSKTHVSLHAMVLTNVPGYEIDHINGDGRDNRKSNLRLATHQHNGANSRKHFKRPGKSKYKGVRPLKSTWNARIGVNHKVFNLGCYSKEEDAARAYDRAAREHFGEFACTNADLYGEY